MRAPSTSSSAARLRNVSGGSANASTDVVASTGQPERPATRNAASDSSQSVTTVAGTSRISVIAPATMRAIRRGLAGTESDRARRRSAAVAAPRRRAWSSAVAASRAAAALCA